MSVRIRDFREHADYEACAKLQMEVWQFPASDVVPPMHLVAMHHYGGVCIGAFDDGRMVGFVCGFSAWEKGRAYHHSHMLAVLSAYRGQSIGEKLKWAQCDRVLEQGIELVNWTFDPLQALNAYLNIQRLGAIARTYRVDLYGESKSPLHGGMPTDRFEVEWHLKSHRTLSARDGEPPGWPDWQSLPRANSVTTPRDGLAACDEELHLDLDAEAFLIAIPGNINEVMIQSKELALDWRAKTRRLFQAYFESDYRVAGFHRDEGLGFYRLEREDGPVTD